jgi:SSS family solute:Na+ symporter
MGGLDLGIVGLYLAAMIGLSAWLARSQTSPADYYVGGRRLPWGALAISTLATQSSANSFIGIPAFVALVPGGGLTWLQYELALPLALLVVMAVFVPVFRGLGLISIYEYLELRFDRATRLLLSAVFIASRALAAGVALYAAAVVIEVCTGLPLAFSVLLMGVATVVYDTLGGMRAVVWTDVVQMALLVLGVLACIGWALNEAGGWSAAWQAVDPARLAAIDPGHGVGDGARAPLWGFVVGGFVLYVAYYGVDQSQVQRQLAATDIGRAQRLLLANALLRFPLTLLYALLGVSLAAVLAGSPELRATIPEGRWDYLVPRFIETHLPVGLRGLLVAAVLAAAMSSLDSALNSLSAATLRDFVEPRLPPTTTPRQRLLASRLSTLLWGAVMTLVGLQAGDWASNVIEGINRVGALFYGPLLAAFACGILDRRASGPAVRAGVAAGLALNLALWWAFGAQLFWMWWNVSGLLAAAGTTILWSRLGARGTARPSGPAVMASAAPLRAGWQGLGGIALGLAAYTAAMVAVLVWLGARTSF